MILLSVLIGAIPRRRELAQKLWDKLEGQVSQMFQPERFELVLIQDNLRRSIGEKRNALLRVAQGEFIAFVDDDDDVSDDYINALSYALTTTYPQPDLVTFEMKCTVNGEEAIVVPHHENKFSEEFRPGARIQREPHMLCVWRRTLAVTAEFPNTNYGEDFPWSRKVLPLVKNWAHIDALLYHYQLDEKSPIRETNMSIGEVVR